MKGIARIKKTSKYIYKDIDMQILGIYSVYKDGFDVYPDNSRTFKVSLEGSEWDDRAYAVIHESELDITGFELDAEEQAAFDFIMKNNKSMSNLELLSNFLKGQQPNPNNPDFIYYMEKFGWEQNEDPFKFTRGSVQPINVKHGLGETNIRKLWLSVEDKKKTVESLREEYALNPLTSNLSYAEFLENKLTK